MEYKTVVSFSRDGNFYEIKAPVSLDVEKVFSLDLLDPPDKVLSTWELYDKRCKKLEELYDKRCEMYDEIEEDVANLKVYKNGEDLFVPPKLIYTKTEIGILFEAGEMYINDISGTVFSEIDDGLKKVKEEAVQRNNEKAKEIIDNKALSPDERKNLESLISEKASPYYFSIKNNKIYELDYLSDNGIGYVHFGDTLMFDAKKEDIVTDIPEFYLEFVYDDIADNQKVYMLASLVTVSLIGEKIKEFAPELEPDSTPDI